MHFLKSEKSLWTYSGTLLRIPRVCGRSSVFTWMLSNTLCTSGFLIDVILSYNGPYDGVALAQQLRCSVCMQPNSIAAWYSFRPVLARRRRAPRLDEPLVQGALGQNIRYTAVVLYTVAVVLYRAPSPILLLPHLKRSQFSRDHVYETKIMIISEAYGR